MTRAAYPLKLPNSIKQAAQRLAKEDGVSLNQWISSAVAQKVGSVETAAEFFKRRAARAKGGASLMNFLVNAPDVPESSPATAVIQKPASGNASLSGRARDVSGQITSKRSDAMVKTVRFAFGSGRNEPNRKAKRA
jgi:hypothetical protein